MVNLPEDLYVDYNHLMLTTYFASTSAPPPTFVSYPDLGMIRSWISLLHSYNPLESDSALQNLAYHRNKFENMPMLLWRSRETVTMLMNEVIRAHRQIVGLFVPPFFPPLKPLRVYNILLLFQRIAHCPETRGDFLKAKMPIYFYPLMDMGLVAKPYECLRLGALGVTGHLLKGQRDEAAINFLMDTGAFRYCLKPVEFGNTDSKTIAVNILHNIMSTDEGLQYCCVLSDRFFVINDVLKKSLVHLTTMTIPASSLFSLVASCYAKLSQKSRACAGLRRYLPVLMFDGTFARLLAEDPVADNYYKQLIHNLEN